MAKRLFNRSEEVVTDSIEGTLLGCGGQVARLEYKNTVRVLVRNDAEFKRDKVALISGGGSGHEPSHAGWIGKGLLSAAVCGDVFASPSTEAVLAAIKAVTGPAGCLVILKNYTGDRLNFGLAVEKAKAEGYKCEMLVVADDKAIPEAPQPRGIAGALFIHKVAGAAAEQGKSLEEIKTLVDDVSKRISSMGMAITACTLPGATPSERLDEKTVEYGLGIHGEPGRVREPLKSSKETAEYLVQHLVSELPDRNANFALLINNLGTLPPLEMNIVVRDVVRSLEKESIAVKKITTMTAMTSLDMAGFSVSLCDLSGIEDLLMFPTSVSTWVPFTDVVLEVPVVPCPEVSQSNLLNPPETLTEEGQQIINLIKAACDAIIEAEPELTAADKIVGDGDCGLTLKSGAERILEDVERYPVDSLSKTLSAIGSSAGQSMGGTSGVLYSLGFSAAGAAVLGGGTWREALRAGTEAISRYGGAKEGMRTMLDALFPASRASASIPEMVAAAKKGAEETGSLELAGAGRSSYIPGEILKGTADPGASAVGIWLEALASVST